MLPRELERLGGAPALAAAVRRAFERHGSIPPRDITIDYVRFKPDTSCVLGLRDVDSSLPPIGYVKVFLAGDPEECVRKYRGRARGDGWAEALPGLSAAFFRFPLDRSVAGLRAVADIGALKHVVHDVVPGLSPDEERVRARRSRASVLRYKPERRCLVRADLETKDRSGATRERRLVAQAYADGSGARVHRVMRRLWDRDARAADALRVPRPLGYHPGRRILLQEWVDGDPWGAALGAAGAVDGCRAAARCLRSLHALDAGDLPDLGAPAEAAAAADQVLQDLARVGSAEVGEAALGLARGIARAARNVPSGERALVHGDFHYHQLLIGPGGATLIDWDEAGAGDPRLDVGNFLAHLHLAELDGRLAQAPASGLRHAFLDAYVADRRPEGDLAFFVALHLAKLAMVPFRNLDGGWARASFAILARACDVLDARVGVAA
jgi:aminoglycoside phosphotransferase (APT) family kinase protein